MRSLHFIVNHSWALFVVTAVVCSLRAVQAPTSASPSPSDAVVRAVVQVLAVGPGERGNNQECSATGFLVNEEGYILTNAHVVERAQRCLSASPGAKIMAKPAWPKSRAATAASCDVVALDSLHDLAVIKAERPLGTSAGSAERVFAAIEPSPVPVGTPVVVTGHPAFAWDSVTQYGRVVRRANLRLSEDSAEVAEVIVLDIPLRPGNSGSPVYLRSNGAVVGIVERHDPSRPSETVAVPIRYAIELLDRSGVPWHREAN